MIDYTEDRRLGQAHGKWRVIFSCVTATTFSLMAWQAWRLPPSYNTADIGPSAFPLAIAIGGCLVSLTLLVRPRELRAVPVRNANTVFSTAGLILCYIVSMPFSGFYPASIVLPPLLLLVSGERRPIVITSVTLGFIGVIYLLFDQLLSIEFPMGAW